MVTHIIAYFQRVIYVVQNKLLRVTPYYINKNINAILPKKTLCPRTHTTSYNNRDSSLCQPCWKKARLPGYPTKVQSASSPCASSSSVGMTSFP